MTKDKMNSKKTLNSVKTKKSDYWEKVRADRTLDLFHKAAVGVPAYKRFLKQNKIDHKQIKSWSDFKNVPIVNKKNYLQKNTIKDLCWDDKQSKPSIYTSTSGSSGEPSYFIRQEDLDWQCSVTKELFLSLNPNDIKKPTLVIDCFGMGIWIGGLMTYRAYELAALRNNYPVSIITPGISKNDIFNALKNLAPKYENVIIAGYPPFVRDILEEASDHGVNIKKLNVKVQFAAEAITENFRDYVAKETGMKNIYLDSLNIYGSADIGAMAFEGATSILVKRLAMKNKDLFYDIFSPINKTPTLAQFIPNFINFENVDGEIILSGNSTMPLIRYSIGDNGGVLSFDEVNKIMKKHGINIYKEAKKLGIQNAINELPFVFVYERANLSVSFYGLNMYPEWFKDALLESHVSRYLTGKFSFDSVYDENHNQILEVNLEKREIAKLSKSTKNAISRKIIAALAKNSSEYRELLDKQGHKAHPMFNFIKYGDKNYFSSGVKQRWLKK